MNSSRTPKGRGTSLKPANRFERIELADDWEQLEPVDELIESNRKVPTEYFADVTQSIVAENNSPDIPFRFSINPYRGCTHGCSYCYARPFHEYLGFNAGIDFESKILVKQNAAELFRAFLCKPSWDAEPIMLSGVTDPYQPAERVFRVSRSCLEVALEARQPIRLITKNGLICRDLDLLQEMAHRRIVGVAVSVTTLDSALARVMEPQTSTPAARLDAIGRLSDAGVPVQVMIAPVIPGLTDFEIPDLLEAVKDAGALAANYTLLRLPRAVSPIFRNWLHRHYPDRQAKVEGLIRECRDGKLDDGAFGRRMSGTGRTAQDIAQFFKLFAQKHGLRGERPPLDRSGFRAPDNSSQLRLF